MYQSRYQQIFQFAILIQNIIFQTFYLILTGKQFFTPCWWAIELWMFLRHYVDIREGHETFHKSKAILLKFVLSLCTTASAFLSLASKIQDDSSGTKGRSLALYVRSCSSEAGSRHQKFGCQSDVICLRDGATFRNGGCPERPNVTAPPLESTMKSTPRVNCTQLLNHQWSSVRDLKPERQTREVPEFQIFGKPNI